MTPAVKVNAWNMGKKTMILSLGFTSMTFLENSIFESMFLLLSIAPLGLPVVPEV